ncbi:unnamed protein product [Adineta ricciae]|uniref:Uncharacterized protein n=2 Tax=Adineta ricciae TaxID=249248 RepID=A0A815PVW4_ADIRI|nr:unnamed protein product [Adineta ricciae]
MLFTSLFFLLLAVLSFNEPKLCPTAKWDTVGSRFAVRKPDRRKASGFLFIDKSNTIYTDTGEKGEILVWSKDSTRPTSVISYQSEFTPTSLYVSDNGPMSSISFQSELTPCSLFASNNGDIYLSTTRKGIFKWTASQNVFIHFMDIKPRCACLFIDINYNLYCSMYESHRVVKKSLNKSKEADPTIVAGTGSSGRGETQLSDPQGIFVDANSNLYVADSLNNRIQLFEFGELKGKTVAGADSYEITILLFTPTSVALDYEKFLYITDLGNDRIIGSGPNGFRCLLGCNHEKQKASQLMYPRLFHFDVNGNLFVSDKNNMEVRKFPLKDNSCGNVPSTIQAMYSSTLTYHHEMFSRELYNSSLAYYYEAIQVNVSKSDFYILTGNSSIGLYGFMYKDHFSRFDLLTNLIAWYGKPVSKDQFKFTVELQMNTAYILVVTTYYRNVTGPFSIIIFGSNIVHLQRMNVERVIQSTYRSTLTKNHSTNARKLCVELWTMVRYEAIQVNVTENGFYTFLSIRNDTLPLTTISSYIYERVFYPRIPMGNLISEEEKRCNSNHDTVTVRLMANIQYVLVVAVLDDIAITDFKVEVFGRSTVGLERVDPSPVVGFEYSSSLTAHSQTYAKDCTSSQYYYETIRITTSKNGYYYFLIGPNKTIVVDMYKNQFDPLHWHENLALTKCLEHSYTACNQFSAHIQANTMYILVITTFRPQTPMNYSIQIYGSENFTFERLNDDSTDCYIGDPCNPQVKSIGVTLDAILRVVVKQDKTIKDQPFSIKMSAAVIIIMFVAGIINCLCSILTFQNEILRKVGCGLYLLASSTPVLHSLILHYSEGNKTAYWTFFCFLY